MVVLVLEKVPQGLRGELSRWFLEPKAGVFVGKVSALVRDLLGEKVLRDKRQGGAMMISSSDKEQGFNIRTPGDTSREVVDFEGRLLIRIPQ